MDYRFSFFTWKQGIRQLAKLATSKDKHPSRYQPADDKEKNKKKIQGGISYRLFENRRRCRAFSVSPHNNLFFILFINLLPDSLCIEDEVYKFPDSPFSPG
jgi:hypothetical protein